MGRFCLQHHRQPVHVTKHKTTNKQQHSNTTTGGSVQEGWAGLAGLMGPSPRSPLCQSTAAKGGGRGTPPHPPGRGCGGDAVGDLQRDRRHRQHHHHDQQVCAAARTPAYGWVAGAFSAGRTNEALRLREMRPAGFTSGIHPVISSHRPKC